MFNLKTFDEVNSKIETDLWILKDLFYRCNKDLRRTLENGYDEDTDKENEEIELMEVYKSSQQVSNIYEKEIKWLKSKNDHHTKQMIQLKHKHKDLKQVLKKNDDSWKRLKAENDNLIEIIKELENDVTDNNKSDIKVRSKIHQELEDISKSHKKEKLRVRNINDMIGKINKLVDDKESESGTSHSSEHYKTEIQHLNQIIDTLVTKLQTPVKSPEEDEYA